MKSAQLAFVSCAALLTTVACTRSDDRATEDRDTAADAGGGGGGMGPSVGRGGSGETLGITLDTGTNDSDPEAPQRLSMPCRAETTRMCGREASYSRRSRRAGPRPTSRPSFST